MSTLFQTSLTQEEELIVTRIIIDLADKNGHVNDEEILHELIRRSQYKDSYENIKRAIMRGFYRTAGAGSYVQRAKHMVYLALSMLFEKEDPE